MDFRVYKSIFYNKKAANFIKFAAFLPISGISFPIFIREHVQICYNIIPFKSSISYSFICYLQGLSSFPDYKDTTFKRICQEEHPIKFIPNVFIRNIAPLLLIFCVENHINLMNIILCLFDSMYRSHSGSFTSHQTRWHHS